MITFYCPSCGHKNSQPVRRECINCGMIHDTLTQLSVIDEALAIRRIRLDNTFKQLIESFDEMQFTTYQRGMIGYENGKGIDDYDGKYKLYWTTGWLRAEYIEKAQRTNKCKREETS